MLSFTFINLHSSVPPIAIPRSPRPIIWLYKTTDLVGRAIQTTSIFGASKPVERTP
jgi:hypothetical protein